MNSEPRKLLFEYREDYEAVADSIAYSLNYCSMDSDASNKLLDFLKSEAELAPRKIDKQLENEVLDLAIRFYEMICGDKLNREHFSVKVSQSGKIWYLYDEQSGYSYHPIGKSLEFAKAWLTRALAE